MCDSARSGFPPCLILMTWFVHQVTLEWDSVESHKDVPVTGYAVRVDGQHLGDELSRNTRKTTIDNLQPGERRFEACRKLGRHSAWCCGRIEWNNKKQCSRQLQCEVPCRPVMSLILPCPCLPQVMQTQTPFLEGGGSRLGGQGTFHILHYHMVLALKGLCTITVGVCDQPCCIVMFMFDQRQVVLSR